ncbi:MAG: integrase core domain-containing protein [Candidatus Thiodiazotropha sp. (ex Troendleina suluensis)]|nr:integrase core domain-containing protein [Candidatus Thiodiazotropha sp. (ex Troendleina suluensis)]
MTTIPLHPGHVCVADFTHVKLGNIIVYIATVMDVYTRTIISMSVLTTIGISISCSQPGYPWKNGYQESFYGKFKVDLGDINRFDTLGKLEAEIYRTVWYYNHRRIHSIILDQTIIQLRQLNLSGMVNALITKQKQPGTCEGLSFGSACKYWQIMNSMTVAAQTTAFIKSSQTQNSRQSLGQ